MSIFSYLTIQEATEGLFKEKGSKFIAFAYPVHSENEIREKVEKLKKEYFDARHHCYAWMLGADRKQFRAFDDGEPNHSAGDPIFGQIRSKNITNVLVVVVRYFGGVKLGVGGLISAYKSAAEDALNKAFVIEKEVMLTLDLNYSYNATPEIMRLVKVFDLNIIQQEFQEECKMQIEVALRNKSDLYERIRLLQATGHPIVLKDLISETKL